jgi:hypothetical protein
MEADVQNLGLVLLTFAFVFACIAVRLPTVGTWHLLPLAIAVWLAAEIFGGVGRLFGAH